MISIGQEYRSLKFDDSLLGDFYFVQHMRFYRGKGFPSFDECSVTEWDSVFFFAYAQVPPINAHTDVSSGVKGRCIIYIHTMCMQSAMTRLSRCCSTMRLLVPKSHVLALFY